MHSTHANGAELTDQRASRSATSAGEERRGVQSKTVSAAQGPSAPQALQGRGPCSGRSRSCSGQHGKGFKQRGAERPRVRAPQALDEERASALGRAVSWDDGDRSSKEEHKGREGHQRCRGEAPAPGRSTRAAARAETCARLVRCLPPAQTKSEREAEIMHTPAWCSAMRTRHDARALRCVRGRGGS